MQIAQCDDQCMNVLRHGIVDARILGLAAIIIGGIYLYLDQALETKSEARHPTVATTGLGVAYFIAMYWLSGWLCGGLELGLPALHTALGGSGLIAFWLFDSSATAWIVGAATAFFHARTGHIYVGAFLSAMLVTWIVVASQATQYAF